MSVFPAALYLLWQGCKQQASHHLWLSAVRDKDPRPRYPSQSVRTEADKDQMEGILFIGHSPAFPSGLWRSHEMCEQQTAFPAYHRSAALVSVLGCHLLLMEGRVTGEKRRQVDFDVENTVRSTWQPEVKHQLNFGPWRKEVVPFLLQKVNHGQYAEQSYKPFLFAKH